MGWWSATVMGGDTPLDEFDGIMDLALGKGIYDGSNPELLTKEILDEKLATIVAAFGADSPSYYAWHALGVMILERGCAMSEHVRQKVRDAINQDEWAQQQDRHRQAGNPIRVDRIEYMWEFFCAVRDYDGAPTRISEKGLFDKFADMLGG